MFARLVAASVALAFTAHASAQTQFAPEPGGYVSLQTIGLGSAVQLGGSAGYRIGNGVDLGVQSTYDSFSEVQAFSVGPVMGISREIGAGFIARVEATVTAERVRISRPAESGRATLITPDAVATIARSFPIVGSLRIQPALGVYATSQQVLSSSVSRPRDTGLSYCGCTQTGLHLDLPLTFRVFGADAAYVGSVRLATRRLFAIETGEYGSYAGGGIRVNV